LASAALKAQRRWFADEIRWSAKLRSTRLVEALATVPRESFLGRGPWQILGDRAFHRGYEETADSDPGHLSHNVLVAIDARRRLNNGLPSFLASLIDQLDPKPGEIVCHIGCGTGYYSAVMAEIVGQRGRVIAVEVDPALARRSRQNLKRYRQVDVVAADGFAHDPGKVDAILVNAGVTQLSHVWLENLKPRGRIVVPLTLENQGGRVLKATRSSPGWQARFISPIGIYPCVGVRSRSAEARLSKAYASGNTEKVRSLRLDDHKQNRDCWLHDKGYCLSRRKP